MSRFSFKKNCQFDLALLREVQTINPLSAPVRKSGALWMEVAKNLNNCTLKMTVTDRSCRERIQHLLKDFRSDESRSLKALGIAEKEMTELTSLLTSVSEQESQKVKIPQNSKSARLAAEETRNRAVENIETMDEPLISDDFQDVFLADEQAEIDLVEMPTLKKMKMDSCVVSPKARTGDRAILQHLKEKSKGELAFKSEELKVRAIEAENRKLELEMQREKQLADIEKQQADITERSKITDLLLKLVQERNK